MGGITVPAPPQLQAKPGNPSVGKGPKVSNKRDPFSNLGFPDAVMRNTGGKTKANSGGGSWDGKDSDDEVDDATGTSDGGFFSLSIPGFEEVGKVIHYILDPVWWQRVGIGALGFFILLVGIFLIVSSTKTGKKVIKTAGGAAVGGPAGAVAGASS